MGHPPRLLGITAHRGASADAPENTFAAIELAIDHGAHRVEIDVRLAADGVVVVCHDAELVRLAGVDQRVADLTSAELASLDVGRWFGPAFAGERIPMLREALEATAGRVGLTIELKSDGDGPALAAAAAATVRDARRLDDCLLMSFDGASVATLASVERGARRGLVARSLSAPGSLDGFHALAIGDRGATAEALERAADAGVERHVWTVNDPARAAELAALGVDQIITDVPAVMAEALAAKDR